MNVFDYLPTDTLLTKKWIEFYLQAKQSGISFCEGDYLAKFVFSTLSSWAKVPLRELDQRY